MCETATVEVLQAAVTTETYTGIQRSCEAALSASSIADATSCAYQTASASEAAEVTQAARSSLVSPGQVSALADDTQAQQAAAAARRTAMQAQASLATESTGYADLLSMTSAGGAMHGCKYGLHEKTRCSLMPVHLLCWIDV